jgi:MoxR-like ATPase
LRVPVAPVGDASFAALLALPDAVLAAPAGALRADECAALAAAARRVALGDGFVAGCAALRCWLAARGRALSDRRWRQFVGLARTAAASEGRDTLDRLDLWLAPFVASQAPAEVPALEAWFADEGVQAPPVAAPWLARAVEAFEKQLSLEEQMPTDDGNADVVGKLALARAIGIADPAAPAAGGVGLQRIVSARLEERLRRRWSPVHIAARVAQVREIEAQVAAARAEVAVEADALARALAPRLWMPAGCAAALQARHAAALDLLDGLAARLGAVRAGFAALPPDPEATEVTPPAPVALDPEAA